MAAYREIVKAMGYKDNSAFLVDAGQELHFSKDGVRLGRKVSNATIFVDQMTGEEVENYIVIDRVRIAKEGIIIVMVELEGSTGQITSDPEILTKGFVYEKKEEFAKVLGDNLNRRFANKKDPVSSVGYYKKVIEKAAEEILYREGRSPLVVPVIIEV
jgi:ribonuclease J